MKSILFFTAFFHGLLCMATDIDFNEACIHQSEKLHCHYQGSTGLELFTQLKLHSVQRKFLPVAGDHGSIFLVKDSTLLNSKKYNCWGITFGKQRPQVKMICRLHRLGRLQFPVELRSLIARLQSQ